jgi:hypothetical protein
MAQRQRRGRWRRLNHYRANFSQEHAHERQSRCPTGSVRGWRLDLGVADPLLSVSCESASVPSTCLISIPCHIELDVRFFLIRLTDNHLLGAFKLLTIPILIACHIRSDQNALSFLTLKYSPLVLRSPFSGC